MKEKKSKPQEQTSTVLTHDKQMKTIKKSQREIFIFISLNEGIRYLKAHTLLFSAYVVVMGVIPSPSSLDSVSSHVSETMLLPANNCNFLVPLNGIIYPTYSR